MAKIKFYNKTQEIINNNLLLTITVIYLIIYSINLGNQRPIFVDEAWYSNPAYNFYLGGWIQITNVGSGGDSNFIFPLIQGILFKILGFSLSVARFTSVLGGMFSTYLFYRIFKSLKIENMAILIALFTFWGIILYHATFTMSRPESWSIPFVLFSLLSTLLYFFKKKTKFIILAGVGSGLAFLTHPDTITFIFVNGVMLLLVTIYQKRYFNILWFVMPVFLAGAVFILNYQYILDSPYFLNTIESRSINNSGVINNIVNNLIENIKFYTLPSKTKFFNSLLLTIFLLSGLFFKRKNNYLFISSLYGIAIWFISIILFAKTAYLFQYVFIFSIINIAIIANYLKKYQTVCFGFTILMVFAAIGTNYTRIDNIHSTLAEDWSKGIIPDNSKVFGPLELWYFVPDTRYAPYNFRLDRNWKEHEVTPNNMEYFIYCKNIDMGHNHIRRPLVEKFLTYENKSLIYELESVYYEKISIYKLN